jgi:HlyD family secretion protein
MKKGLIITIAIIIITLLTGFYFVNQKGQPKQTDADALYDFSTVQRMDLSEKVDVTGNAMLSQNTDLYPAYEATVQKIYSKAGDLVKKGALLMVLDSPLMEDTWTQANSNLQQAQINLSAAQKDLDRCKILLEAQGATQAEVETAQSKVDLYQEQLNLARFKVDQMNQQPDNANFIDSAHQNLLIRAPLDGEVAWISARPGDKVLTQTLLLTMTANNSLEIEAQVDESEIKLVQPGQPVNISSNDQNQTQLTGVVTEVGNIGTDVSGVVNFPIRVKAATASRILKPGMTVDLTIMVESHPNVLSVPSGAVVERRGRTMVAVKKKEGVVFTRVEVGVKSGSNTEITSGLQAGDTIAIPKPKAPKPTQQHNGGMRMNPFGR